MAIGALDTAADAGALRAELAALGAALARDPAQRKRILADVPVSALVRIAAEHRDSPDVVAAASRVLALLLADTPFRAIAAEHEDVLAQALASGDAPLQELALTQLRKALATPEDASILLHSRILPLLVDTLATASALAVSTRVHVLLVDLARSEVGQSAIYALGTMEHILEVGKGDPASELRVLDMLADAALLSPNHFRLTRESGVFTQATRAYTGSRDPLFKLNVLEILGRLCGKSCAAFEMLDAEGFIAEQLAGRILHQEDTEGALLRPAAVKFFVQCFSNDEGVSATQIDKHGVVSYFKSVLETGGDPVAEEHVACALAAIMSCERHYSFISTHPSRVLELFVALLKDSHGDRRVCFLQNLSIILGIAAPAADSIQETTSKAIYMQLGGGRFMLALVRDTQTAFEQHKTVAYACLAGIARHAWGIAALHDSQQFMTWVFDRAAEASKVGKEWKFSVMEAIVTNPQFDSVISSAGMRAAMKQFLREGPFYVAPVAAVAFESSA